MEIEVITTKRKLTSSILNQIEEATVQEMRNALWTEGGILGYINPPNVGKQRVFLINPAPQVYKLVTNYDWSKGIEHETTAYGKSYSGKVVATVKKQFKDKQSRDEFVRLFKEVKMIALMNHIYV